MAQDVISEMDKVSWLLPIVEALIRGYCFFRLAKPFTKKKKSAFCAGMAYFLMILLLYMIPLYLHAWQAYSIGGLIMFFGVCLMDRRNYNQKAFLVMIFFSLSWLSSAVAEILYDHVYALAENMDYIKNHPNMALALYTGVCVFYLILEFAFTAIGIWLVLKVYKNKNVDMEKKELVMLVLPSLMGLLAYMIIQNYRMFYIVEIGKSKNIYDALIVLFYVVSVIVIVVDIVLHQNIRAKQEENRQTELLAVQIDSIRQHIEQVEGFYQNIRSVKHDMTNHLLTLERLYEGNKTEEAKAYSRDLKEELARMTGEMGSGNPVTDVILQELKKEAERRGISFHSEFYYPTDSDVNAFDISVILNNALQNAIENIREGGGRHISIVSYRRNNAFMIEIRNSFVGNLQWDAERGLPVTSKEKADGHGYGLMNIRRVAGKYAGDIDIVLKDGEFRLSVMLMLV